MNLQILTNLTHHINIDSATAQAIAHEYIRYKYYDSALVFICVIGFFATFLFVVKDRLKD